MGQQGMDHDIAANKKGRHGDLVLHWTVMSRHIREPCLNLIENS